MSAKRLNRLLRIEVVAVILVGEVEPGTDDRDAPHAAGGHQALRLPALERLLDRKRWQQRRVRRESAIAEHRAERSQRGGRLEVLRRLRGSFAARQIPPAHAAAAPRGTRAPAPRPPTSSDRCHGARERCRANCRRSFVCGEAMPVIRSSRRCSRMRAAASRPPNPGMFRSVTGGSVVNDVPYCQK